jgi:hypothetical protein
MYVFMKKHRRNSEWLLLGGGLLFQMAVNKLYKIDVSFVVHTLWLNVFFHVFFVYHSGAFGKETEVLQHCMSFALSTTEFQRHCPHLHAQHCQTCVELDETLQKVLQLAEERKVDNKDAVMFKVFGSNDLECIFCLLQTCYILKMMTLFV